MIHSLKPVPQPGILNIQPYVPGISTLAGIDNVVKLSSNENAWGPSPYALEAYEKASKHLYKYPDGNATVLREALAEVYNLPMNQLMVGTGSDEILNLVATAYAGVGDEVIYSAHSFLVYPIAARMAGATPVSVPEKNLRVDIDAMLAAVTPRTKIIYLCTPNNPTGAIVSSADIKRLHAGLRPDILLVIDGAYAEFAQNPDYDSGESLVRDHENVMMTRTFSKVYGLAGLRVGWTYAPEGVLGVLNRIRGPFNVNLPALYATAAACYDTAWTAEIVQKTVSQRHRLEEKCRELGILFTPSDANFLLLHCDAEGEKSAKALDTFLKTQGIIVRRMEAYHLPQCLRVSVGTEDQNTAFLKALASFVKKSSQETLTKSSVIPHPEP